MFASIHVPIVDARAFDDSSEQLAKPSWPIPRANEFIRCFGPIRTRRGSAPFPSVWSDEEFYAKADRAIRIPPFLKQGEAQHSQNLARLRAGSRIAYRRLYCTRGPLARLEIGIYLKPEVTALFNLRFDLLLNQILELPVEIPVWGAQCCKSTLGRLSTPTSQLFACATVPTRSSRPVPEVLVLPGESLLMLQCLPRELSTEPPTPFRRMNLTAHARRTLACSRIYFASILRRTYATHVRIVETRVFRNEHDRRLRSGMARLHAERQVLSTVLRLIAADILQIAPGTKGTKSLGKYLTRSTKWLDQDHIASLPQKEIEPIAAVHELGYTEAQRRIILRELSRITHDVAETVERFMSKQEKHGAASVTTIQAYGPTVINYTEIQVQGDLRMKTINIGDNNKITAPIVVADHIERSFNTAHELAEQDNRRELLEELVVKIGQLCEKLEAEKAEETSRTLETFVNEVKVEAPRKDWLEFSGQGLIDAAKTVAELADPIVKTVKTLLGIFAIVI